jgi:hypothetical protein
MRKLNTSDKIKPGDDQNDDRSILNKPNQSHLADPWKDIEVVTAMVQRCSAPQPCKGDQNGSRNARRGSP